MSMRTATAHLRRRSNDDGLEAVKAACEVTFDLVRRWSGEDPGLSFDALARRSALVVLYWAAERAGARPDEIAERVEEYLADAVRDHLVASHDVKAGDAASRLARRLVAKMPEADDLADAVAARRAVML